MNTFISKVKVCVYARSLQEEKDSKCSFEKTRQKDMVTCSLSRKELLELQRYHSVVRVEGIHFHPGYRQDSDSSCPEEFKRPLIVLQCSE